MHRFTSLPLQADFAKDLEQLLGEEVDTWISFIDECMQYISDEAETSPHGSTGCKGQVCLVVEVL